MSTARKKNTHVSTIIFDHFNHETCKSVGSVDRSNLNENLIRSMTAKTGGELKNIDGLKHKNFT